MPTCNKCGKSFPYFMWVNGKRRANNHRKRCFECSPYRQKFDSDVKSEKADYLLDYYYRRQSRKLDLVALKGGRCAKCGYDKCLDALVFHHRDESLKEFPLSKEYLWKTKWDRILAEAEKCDLLCANCHFEAHSKQTQTVAECLAGR